MDINKSHTLGLPTTLVFIFYCHQLLAQTTAADLIQMDFEELVNMEVEIESAGKIKTRAMDLPYAAFVVTANDIRDSGAKSIPEALRLAPGVTADKISNSEWSLSIRGAGGRFSRYVLVLVNGRTAYNTIFSGVNWDELNLTLSDIDRIEVIRGPNAAAWGANAVNGIINIITRRPTQLQPTEINAWVGSEDHHGFSARSEHTLNPDWLLALSGHYGQEGGLSTVSGTYRESEKRDWRISSSLGSDTAQHQILFTADIFGSKQAPLWSWISDSPPNTPIAYNREEKQGWALQLNYQQNLNLNWSWNLRAAIDSTDRDTLLYQWEATNNQLDIEFSGKWLNHNISAGVNTRTTDSQIISDPD